MPSCSSRSFTFLTALLLAVSGASLALAGTAPSSPMAAVKAAYESGDYAGAVKLLKAAAENGDPHAECGLGVMYEHGRGVSKDIKQALIWYHKAAAQKDGRAENNLGWLYARGKGVPSDPGQALLWFQAAARDSRDDWGRALAWNNLGNAYFFGHGTPQDYRKAADAYGRAASSGNPESENKMGYLCEHGLGLGRDLKAAAAWYRKAASQGFCNGENNLAYLYETGQGVMLSYGKAFQLYSKAAEGNPYAAEKLGGLYEHALGTKRDLVEACRWYLRAAAQGNEGAKENAERLRLVLSPAQWAVAQSKAGNGEGKP